MKKKYLIIIIALLILLTAGLILLLTRDSGNYTVKVNIIDDYSPDRILTVYKDGKEIDFKEIRKMNGTLLCEEGISSVYYGEIKNESSLKVILNNDKEVVAKVVKGD